jgi:hypothetical protein
MKTVISWVVWIATIMSVTAGIGAPGPKVEVEVIYLRAGGFMPKVITRPVGRFLLVIENRSRTQTTSFNLKRADGLVGIAANASTLHSQSFLLDLPAGEYKLSDSNQTGWSPITITIK